MRLFVGILLSKKVREEVAKWQAAYIKQYSPQGIRWIQNGNLHVTLLPPWEGEDKRQAITAFCSIQLPISSFVIAYKRIIFRPHKNARYIWVTGPEPFAFQELRSYLALQLYRENEKKMLHTTIARIKEGTKYTPIEEEIDWHFLVTQVTLLESDLLPTCAKYRVLAHLPLKDFKIPLQEE